MSRTLHRSLLAACVLLAASAAASGQEADKRAAIGKLLEVGGGARQSQLIFEKLFDRFRRPMANSIIAGLKADGHFNSLSADEGAELERRVRVFLDEVFDESKGVVAREVATPENLERIAAPAYDKYLTLDEVNGLIAFEQTPLGRKLNVLLPEAMAEGVVATLEAKGVFDALPEEMTAKLQQSLSEVQSDSSRALQEVLTRAAFTSRLTADEVKELAAFRETPLGRKFVGVYPRLQGEIQASFSSLYGRRVGGKLGEIYTRKLEEYAVWLSEATRPGAPRGVPPPPPVRPSLPSTQPPGGRP